MNNGVSLFKKIDEFIFTQVENFKQSPFYNQLLDQTSALDEETQKKINYLTSILIVITPILIIIFLQFRNIGVQNSLKAKREIQISLSEISSKLRRLKNVEGNLIGPTTIASEGELQNGINMILKPFNISPDKITISGFEITESLTNLKKVSSKIDFKNLSLNEVTNILRDLIVKEKMIIPEIFIKKDPSTEFLTGTFKIYHHFRNE